MVDYTIILACFKSWCCLLKPFAFYQLSISLSLLSDSIRIHLDIHTAELEKIPQLQSVQLLHQPIHSGGLLLTLIK